MPEKEYKEILGALITKELDTMTIALDAKVMRTATTLNEYIQLRQAQGSSLEVIREDLLTDLEEGGRIFGEFKNALKPTYQGSTGRLRDAGELTELGVQTKFRWCAVLINTCPDCLERHNQVKTLTEWEEAGLPRANATVCEQYCHCVLMPEIAVELPPIYRG